MSNRWPSRLAALSLWGLAALSATYWMLKVAGVSEAPVLASAISAAPPSVDVRDLARALGPPATVAAPAMATGAAPVQEDPGARMRLLGVVAGRRSGGVALISIDGQLPRPYRVGSQIDASHTLTRVATRSATLSPNQEGGQPFTLELPSTAPEPPPGPTAAGRSAAVRFPGMTQTSPAPPAMPALRAAPADDAAPAANAPANTPAADTEEPARN